jgi:hypothetical protein
MMLFVVKSHYLLGDVGLESIILIQKVGELKLRSDIVRLNENKPTNHDGGHDGDGSVVVLAA